MTANIPPRGDLTSLATALAALLDNVEPLDPTARSLSESKGLIVAEMPPLAMPRPALSYALSDGWALNSIDIIGASSYAPVLTSPPHWIEAGQSLPKTTDCILDPELVTRNGPLAEVLAEAIPGQGTRRAGEDIAAGSSLLAAGQPIQRLHIPVLHIAGVTQVPVRAPRLHLINVAAPDGTGLSEQFIRILAEADGALVSCETASRDVQAITAAVRNADAEIIVLIGGTGRGQTDHTVEALAGFTPIVHGLAIRPGETAALARRGDTPIIALPGLPDQAIGACLLLLRPLIDRLTGRALRQGETRPLAQKIASRIGFVEIALLKQKESMWKVLSVGNIPLGLLVQAEAWLALPAESEGFPAHDLVEAFPL